MKAKGLLVSVLFSTGNLKYILNFLLCRVLSASGSSVHNCIGEQCWDIISVPLIDEMKVTLKADLDHSKLNNVLHKYILEVVTKAVKEFADIQMEKAVNEIHGNVTKLMQSDIQTKFEILKGKYTTIHDKRQHEIFKVKNCYDIIILVVAINI